jgi:hypothetical protein
VESQADVARMEKEQSRYKEVLELLNSMKMGKAGRADLVQQYTFSSEPEVHWP